MAINQAYPSLNDVAPSWADIVIAITADGASALDILDIKGLKWSRKVEVGKQRGASGGRVMKRTTGQGDQDATLIIYRSGKPKLIRALSAAAQTAGLVRGNQVLIGLVSFDIHVQQTPPGSTDIFEAHIKGCRYLGDSDDMKEGTDPDEIEIDLNPIEIVDLVDGKEIVLL